MPLTRYQVRNEYSLADPELYKAADKNDPEALLEGVAMAGLVGVLRQLGDLAEFAAGIFHDLHEEVMATASRGHRLRIRVQQLEAEFPSIEKAYLSQTNHSLFLYNAGIDWHADLRKNQNLITRGDLPRSVMDSYEECRGPPRLFLLDKFDIAGAGACLKRYSDPSFFKTELSSSGTKKSEIQKENKARRIRKKGSYWKIRGTPDDFSISHVKLQQLLSEEGNHTDTNVPINHVKLKKRQLNGFLFYSTNGKSYMERFAETHSLEHKAVCESLGSPPRLKLKSSNSCELDSEMHELSTQSYAGTLLLRDRNQIHSPNREEKILEKVMDDRGEDVIEEATLKMFPDPTSNIELEKVPSDVFKVEDKLEMIVVKETKTDGSADGDRSDDVVSEIDNYMDALNTMESEIETDAESRPKNKHGFFNSQRKRMGSNINEEQKELQSRSSDSNSFGNSSASDDATNSFKKGRFSFSYSDSPSSLAENMLSDGDVAAELDPSTEFCDAESVDISPAKLVENGDVLGTRSSDYPVSNGICNEVSEFPSYMSGLGDASCDSSLTDSTFSLSPSGSEEHANKNQVMGSNAIETSSSFMKDCMFGSSANCIEDSNSNLSGDLPRRISDVEFSPKMRDDILLLGSDKENPEGVLDGQIPDEFSDDMLHLPTLSNLALAKKYSDNAHAEMLPKAYSEDNCYLGDLTNKELDSSHSVSLFTEEQLHGLAEQELETGSCTAFPPGDLPGSPTLADLNDVRLSSNNIIMSTEENSDRTSVTDHPMTGYFVELKFLEKKNEVPSVELGSSSEMERLNKNVLISAKSSDCELKDGPVVDRLHMNFSDSQEKSDTPLDFSSEFSAPDTANEASTVEVPLKFDDLKAGMIHEEADSDAAIVDHNRINSLTEEDHVNMQEQHSCNVHLFQENLSCNGDLGQSKLEITKPVCPEHLVASNTQNEAVIQTSDSSTELYIELSNPESFGPEGSESLNSVHNLKTAEYIDGHFLSSDGKNAATLWGKGNEELINRHPQSDLSENAEDAIWTSWLLPKPEAPSREALELPAKHFSVVPLHNDGESPILLDHEFQRMHISATTNHDGGLDASSTNPFGQPTESQFSEAPTGYKIESFQPSTCSSSSVFPSFYIHHGATHQQVLDPQQIRPVTNFALPDLEALELDMREMPPLPPLPPIQWRIGKLQNSSLASEGKIVQPTVSPLSPVTADEETQWCLSELDGELAQPLNPFLPFLVLKDEELLQCSQIGREMEEPSLNPLSSLAPMVGDEKIKHDFITLERKTAQPLNPFFSSASENENPLDYSLDLGANMLQPSTKPFAPSPTNEDVDGQHPSLNLDDEKVRQDLFTLERKTVQPLNPFISPTIEDEKPQNCSIDLGENIFQPCTNSFAPSPTNEEVDAQNSSLDLDDLKIRHDVLALERNTEESLNPDLSSAIENEKAQHCSLDVGINRLNPSYEDVNAQLSSLDLEGHVLHQLNLLPPIPDIEDETPRDASLALEGEHVQYLEQPVTTEDEESPRTIEDEERQYGSLSLDEEMTWQSDLCAMLPVEEYGKPNGSFLKRLNRPRDPLIEAVASHDKSTLRRVTERVQLQTEEKVDERDSLLQQIRAKSFNLKPAVVARPSIQGPKTNIKVNAILEKANAIRQALAGSDEDDDSESWSDS